MFETKLDKLKFEAKNTQDKLDELNAKRREFAEEKKQIYFSKFQEFIFNCNKHLSRGRKSNEKT